MEEQKDIVRRYSPEDVERLRGTVRVQHTLAQRGAEKFRKLIADEGSYVAALGASTGNQAVQQVRAGLKAVYVSGWQVAADANLAGQMYPDQSLYPANSVPMVVERINSALRRADQVDHSEGKDQRDWLVPLVADAEAGFGGVLNAFELMKSMIGAGAAAVHFEDQLASEKKCGHMGGKVLVPTNQFIKTLTAARLAADVEDVSSVIIARTDAFSAQLLTSDIDPQDHPFIKYGKRTSEGFYHIEGGMDFAIARGMAYAPYADMLWFETSEPNMHQAWQFADAIRHQFPGKLLAYNCSPSFNWKKKLSDVDIGRFQEELSRMGYKFQFVTLAGFHTLNHSMFKLAYDYNNRAMTAYSDLQEEEIIFEKCGYTATKHQHEVGTGYFDLVTEIVSGGSASTKALAESTEAEQF